MGSLGIIWGGQTKNYTTNLSLMHTLFLVEAHSNTGAQATVALWKT